MTPEQAKKYFETMDSFALKRMLKLPNLGTIERDAMKRILAARSKLRREEKNVAQENEKHRIQKRRLKKSMFSEKVSIQYKVGRIRQGGRVNPK